MNKKEEFEVIMQYLEKKKINLKCNSYTYELDNFHIFEAINNTRDKVRLYVVPDFKSCEFAIALVSVYVEKYKNWITLKVNKDMIYDEVKFLALEEK